MGNIIVDKIDNIKIEVIDKNGDRHLITYSSFDEDKESVVLHQEKEIFPFGGSLKVSLDFKCHSLEID